MGVTPFDYSDSRTRLLQLSSKNIRSVTLQSFKKKRGGGGIPGKRQPAI